MVELGFVRTQSDFSLYCKWEKDGVTIYVPIHVDDMLIVSKDSKKIEWFKTEVLKRYKAKDLGEAKYILGIEISRNRADHTLMLTQTKYIDDLSEKYKATGSRVPRTPLPNNFKPRKAEDTPEREKKMRNIPYRALIGAFLYAAVSTRPDIAYSCSVLSRFLALPGWDHWQAALHLLRYLKATRTWGLCYGGKIKPNLIKGYTDADWAGCYDSRRSTTGYVFLMGGAATSWSSKRQATVALSSTESEYSAATQATKEGVWCSRQLKELGYPLKDPLKIYGDNSGCVALAKNPEFHARTKHIEIQHHFIRERVEAKEVQLRWVPTERMVADVLTKSLGRGPFERARDMLGLKARMG